MTESFTNKIHKKSNKSSLNTRDISVSEISRSVDSLSLSEEFENMPPLKNLDNNTSLTSFSPSVLGVYNKIGIPKRQNSSTLFYTKFRDQLQQKQAQIFKEIRKGRIEKVKSILKEYPIPLSIRENKYFDNTLLHQAIKSGKTQFSKYLIAKDFSLLNLTNNQGRTSVHYSLMYNRELFLNILKKLSDKVDWSVIDVSQENYLQYVRFYKYDQFVCEEVRKKMSSVQTLKQRHVKFCLTNNQNRPLTQHSPILVQNNIKTSVYEQRKSLISSSQQNIFTEDTTLSDFFILSQIGEGHFAKVYKVQHIKTGFIFAMKVFLKQQLTHQKMKYVLNEKNLLMKLNHSFLIEIYCCFETPDLYCYIMDYCQGTLRDLLDQEVQISQNKIKLIACELIAVVGYLHLHGVMYRDLKPDNIAYSEDGHICLIDLKLSKNNLTAHSFCGSHPYLSPEMINSKMYDKSIDWYMLGNVIYELASGKTPFYDDDVNELHKKIATQEPKLLTDVSPQMQDFIAKLLEKDPLKRLGIKYDAEQLKTHAWFNDIEWDSIQRRRYRISSLPSSTQKQGINKNANLYFSQIITPASQFNFIEVPGWTTIKNNTY